MLPKPSAISVWPVRASGAVHLPETSGRGTSRLLALPICLTSLPLLKGTGLPSRSNEVKLKLLVRCSMRSRSIRQRLLEVANPDDVDRNLPRRHLQVPLFGHRGGERRRRGHAIGWRRHHRTPPERPRIGAHPESISTRNRTGPSAPFDPSPAGPSRGFASRWRSRPEGRGIPGGVC